MEETEQVDTPQLTDQDSLLQIQRTQPPDLDRSRTVTGVFHDQVITRQLIHSEIGRDPLSTDFLVSLFVSALKTYKRDSVLRPFPPVAAFADGKDFDKLNALADCLPTIENALVLASDTKPEALKLLWWILDTRNFILRVSQKTFDEIKSLTGQTVGTPEPNHVFEIQYSAEINAKFEKERRGRDLIYAYHGSRIENFHSILRNGLCNHLNKNSFFGKGTYLSSELNVCMPYCQTGRGWSKSRIGDRLSCIAVCEIITDSKVRCHSRHNKESKSEVPEKYYIVQNDELLRVRYLLLYAEKSFTNRSEVNLRDCQGSGGGFNNWLSRHRFLFFILAYLVLLAAIGLGSCNFKMKWLKKYFKY